MENGAVAEARTKAFLMDRFWILERSVDIQGVDLFIQRRLTSQNFLEKQPPRFGVIQVKYIQDERTTHYLRPEYVCNKDGEPHDEFFLIIHSGKEENKRKFLLSSQDIVQKFTVSKYKKGKAYMIPGRLILTNSRFEILSDSLALDRIEHALKTADFLENRRFLSWVIPSYDAFSLDDIKSEYIIPLDNWWGDIPEGFYRLKKRVNNLIIDMSEIMTVLNGIVTMNDPADALSLIEDLSVNMRHDSGGMSLIFTADIYDEDFYSVVLYHKEKILLLKENGYLDKYIIIGKKFEEFICNDLAPRMILAPELAYVITVEYDHIALNNWFFDSEIILRQDLNIRYPDQSEHNFHDYGGILNSILGEITLFCVPGLLGLIKEDGNSWGERIKEKVWILARPFMEEVYNNLEMHITVG